VIEQVLGGPPRDHPIGDRVGVALVRIARLADPAFELHAATLLHHVRGLMRRRVQIRRRAERDRVAVRVGVRAELS